MPNPFFLFENALELGTLTSTGDAAGFPKENVTDWRLGTPYRWKADSTSNTRYLQVDLGSGNEQKADTCVVGGHNMADAGCRFDIEGSINGTSWSTVFFGAVATNNNPIVAEFSSPLARRYWRVTFDTGAGAMSEAVQAGSVVLGRKLELPGLKPSLNPYDETAVTDWNVSRSGNLLGSNLRYIEKSISLNYDDIGIARTEFFDTIAVNFDEHFKPHARSKPFWFAFNTTLDSDWVYLCRVDGSISNPFFVTTARRSLAMSLVAVANY